jgi:ankyrin repeat protein
MEIILTICCLQDGNTPLCIAASLKHTEIVRRLRSFPGTNANAANKVCMGYEWDWFHACWKERKLQTLLHWKRTLSHWKRTLSHWKCTLLHWKCTLLHWKRTQVHIVALEAHTTALEVHIVAPEGHHCSGREATIVVEGHCSGREATIVVEGRPPL